MSERHALRNGALQNKYQEGDKRKVKKPLGGRGNASPPITIVVLIDAKYSALYRLLHRSVATSC